MNNRWKTKHVETEMAQRLSTFFQRSPTDATKPPLARCGGMFWLFKRHLCLVRFANTLECEVGRLWEAAMCVGRFQHFTSAFLWNKESNRQIKLVKNITLRISCRPKTNMADIQYGIYWNEIYRERSSSKAQIIFPGRLIFSHELQQNSIAYLFSFTPNQLLEEEKKKTALAIKTKVTFAKLDGRRLVACVEREERSSSRHRRKSCVHSSDLGDVQLLQLQLRFSSPLAGRVKL